MTDFTNAENLAQFVLGGGFQSALAKFPTVQADTIIALDKTIDAANAWKLAIARAGEIVDDVKKGTSG